MGRLESTAGRSLSMTCLILSIEYIFELEHLILFNILYYYILHFNIWYYYTLIYLESAHGVMIIVVGNGYGDPSS